ACGASSAKTTDAGSAWAACPARGATSKRIGREEGSDRDSVGKARHSAREAIMFADFTAFTWFHTILSILALIAGAVVMSMLINNRRPDLWTVTFLLTMIATDVTGFGFPFTKLLPSHYTGILSLVMLALALLAQYVFRFAGAWRWIYAITMG